MSVQVLAINPEIYGVEFSAESSKSADTAIKILSFENLAQGWHYGSGGPIRSSIAASALDIYWQFSSLGFDVTDAFPGTYGEVMVTAYHGSHYVELIAETDGSVSVLYERKGNEVYDEERLELSKAIELLQKISEEIRAGETWNTSDFYTKTILTQIPTKIASKVWRSGIRAMGSPSSSWTALITEVEASASMPDNFTLITSQENLQYFGNSTSPYFQQVAS